MNIDNTRRLLKTLEKTPNHKLSRGHWTVTIPTIKIGTTNELHCPLGADMAQHEPLFSDTSIGNFTLACGVYGREITMQVLELFDWAPSRLAGKRRVLKYLRDVLSNV